MNEDHVEIASAELCEHVDDSLDLKMISIRLEKQLLEEFRFIADRYGMGYQPLMRQVLGKWARTELSVIAHDLQRQLAERPTDAP
jgi:hypothetical protein